MSALEQNTQQQPNCWEEQNTNFFLDLESGRAEGIKDEKKIIKIKKKMR